MGIVRPLMSNEFRTIYRCVRNNQFDCSNYPLRKIKLFYYYYIYIITIIQISEQCINLLNTRASFPQVIQYNTI